jgi:hypothetical protein
VHLILDPGALAHQVRTAHHLPTQTAGQPALVAHKRRKLELAAWALSRRGNYREPGAAYL